MQTITWNGMEWRLPAGGRLEYQIERTLQALIGAAANGHGMVLYEAMELRGRAKTYADRYAVAFGRFAAANPDLLSPGPYGPAGGGGYAYIGDGPIPCPCRSRRSPMTRFV